MGKLIACGGKTPITPMVPALRTAWVAHCDDYEGAPPGCQLSPWQAQGVFGASGKTESFSAYEVPRRRTFATLYSPPSPGEFAEPPAVE
jgi:hypothetical protein